MVAWRSNAKGFDRSVEKSGALSLHHWSLPDGGPLVQWTCQKEGMIVEHWSMMVPPSD